jgi:type I restriction enzyme S subunit
MNFAAYPRMKKPSGLPWLSEIPEHWQVKKVAHVFRLGRGRVISREEAEAKPGPYPVYSSQTEDEGQFGSIDTYDFEGDYLTWTTDGAYAGTVFTRSGRFNCTNVCGTLKPATPDINLSFARLALNLETRRFVRLDINPKLMNDTMARLRFVFPPKKEQDAIAAFLDAKLGRLDELVRKKERQLALLAEKRQALISHAITRGLNPNAPTKPSGLAWLGSIPAHWQVKRVKYLVTKIGSGKTPLGGSQVYTAEGVIFLRSQNVHDDGFRLDDVVCISDKIDEELSASRVEPNDILLNITGASIGRVCKFPSGMPRANVNQHVCIVRPHHRFSPDYLAYALQSRFTKHQIFAGETGTSREGLNFEQVGNLLVFGPFHAREEQTAIAMALERTLAALAGATAKLTEQLSKLREYRQALITVAVTGQVAIPEEAA